jgi:hypothetical protein
MNDDELDRLKERQTEIYRDYGVWGSTGLAWSSEQAAGEDPIHGRSEAAHQLSQAFNDAARPLYDAQEALADIRKLNVDGAWTGAAHNAAADAVKALYDDVVRAYLNFKEIADHLRAYGERLAPAQRNDETGQAELRQAAADANKLTFGPIPKIAGLGYDGDAMRAAHHLAMAGIDARVAAHTEARDNGADFTSAMHDIASKARGRNLGSGSLTPIDDVILAEAGEGQSSILTPAMEKRASDALNGLSNEDRARMLTLLATSISPEQRAYLMKALAAGYSVDEVAKFDTMIAAHGNDPDWLDQHLSPLALDSSVSNDQKNWNKFDGAEWSQGENPTCVASSTVVARAEVDPLYALQLTSGGHPGDPAFDNPAAFTDRLHDEQKSVYDGGRHWYVNWWHDGMTDGQSETITNAEIAPHTGTGYDNVEMKDQQSRETTMRSVERAVDDGYPVPLIVRQDGEGGHQMMVIGHAEGNLQIYNPWGYTYWVTEDEFVAGRVDGIDSLIPSTPTSVRLPQEANR